MWEAERDVFTFQVQQPLIDNKAPTKRNVLSAIASLFDLLQFLAPLTVRAKVLMQEIWIAGVDCDDELPENLKAKWEKWVLELPQLSNVAALVVYVEHTQRALNYTYFQMLLMMPLHQLPI